MRELDALLLAWIDTRYSFVDDKTRQQFQELLELQDPELMGLLNGSYPVSSISSFTTNTGKDANKNDNRNTFGDASGQASLDILIKEIRTAIAT